MNLQSSLSLSKILQAHCLHAQGYEGLPLLVIFGIQLFSWQVPCPVADAASASAKPDLHVPNGCVNCLWGTSMYNSYRNKFLVHNGLSCTAAEVADHVMSV